jgi:hypothetical protein
MSTIPSSTKVTVNQFSYVCVNPSCSLSHPNYKNTGTQTSRKCARCGKALRRIAGEPYGTQHPPRR